jgi:hypothetical protein
MSLLGGVPWYKVPVKLASTIVFSVCYGLQLLMSLASRVSGFTAGMAGQAMAWWLELVPGFSLAALHGMLQLEMTKQWLKLLQSMILVSGLLTTSTYQAVYSGYYEPKNLTMPSTVAAHRLLGNKMELCRVVNLASFCCSLASIMASTVIIIWLNHYVLCDIKGKVMLRSWAAALVHSTYTLALATFCMSLLLAFFAAALAALGFMTQPWSLLLAVMVLLWWSASPSQCLHRPRLALHAPGAGAWPALGSLTARSLT